MICFATRSHRSRSLYPSAREEIRGALRLKGELFGAEEEAAGYQALTRELGAAVDRAKELEPDLAEKDLTAGEVVEVLDRHGVEHGITPEVLEMEVQVPAPPEEWDVVKMPADEVPSDEHGIPLRSAAPDGFYLGEVFVDPLRAEAIRAYAGRLTFEKFVEEIPEEQTREYEELRREIVDTLSVGDYSVKEVEEIADDAIDKMLRKSYLDFLAAVVKEEPEPQGMIDALKGKETAAAKRYQKRVLQPLVEEMVHEFTEQQIAAGEIIRTYDEHGNEMLKINEEHPNGKKTVRELEEKKAALRPERRNIFEALQDEKRDEHRMNEFAAMRTTESLSDEEVAELQSRLRRERRGLELQEIRY